MTCPHTSVFFDSAGAGVCLDCHAEISRTKAFDTPKVCAHRAGFGAADINGWAKCIECGVERPAINAKPKQTTVEPTEVQLLRALVQIQGQWIDIHASALDTLDAIAQHNRECDETAPEFFFADLRLQLKLKALHKHACELAADALFLRQQLKESFPNGK